MNLKKCNWYGLNHSKVNEHFEGDLSYVNDMVLSINGNNITAAVYHAKKPNLKKGHKEFMCIAGSNDKFFVFGRTKSQITKDCKTLGLLCNKCKQVVYSTHRHHFNECDCHNIFVDGGKDYFKWGALDLKKVKVVNINLLTDKIKVLRKLNNS